MEKSKRGRPPKFDRDVALESAMGAFWSHGFSATTLDDLAESMGMNRPSIYNAFGDKEAIYLQALERFIEQLKAALAERVVAEPDLAQALRNLYTGALDVYFATEPSLGCFVFCTAPVEATARPAVRAIMTRLLEELDQLLTRKFRAAQKAGTFAPHRDAQLTAKLAQAILHSLAIRARAGESRDTLTRMADAAVSCFTDP